MPKMPDFSKFDFQSIVQNIKTMINPEVNVPNVEEGDPLGAKIVQISTLLQNTVAAHAQSAKDLTRINDLLNELYNDLKLLRKPVAEAGAGEQSAKVEPSSEKMQQEQADVHPEKSKSTNNKDV